MKLNCEDNHALPHDSPLTNLLVERAWAADLKLQARDWPSWSLTARQTCDLELLLNGGFNPLTGFMGQADYDCVCDSMRLKSGALWPIPVVLDVSESFAKQIRPGSKIALRDDENVILAAITVEDVWRPDRLAEAEIIYGTSSKHHPGVKFLMNQVGPIYVGGSVQGLELPQHHDFRHLRHTPQELRCLFQQMGWQQVIVFQTRNPMHRAHFEMTLRAAREHKANLLIHPVVGTTLPGDVDHFCRVRCYEALLPRYPENAVLLSLLPISMRMAGPREAVWHALIRHNYGCSHMIVGRDHAGPGNGNNGKPFYAPYAAQELVQKHQKELGITLIPFHQMVYVPSRRECRPADEIGPKEERLNLSGKEFREYLTKGLEIPDWFTFPEVTAELRKTYPLRKRQGFTLFFTGLSGAGKSTLARAMHELLLEIGPRPVSLLDGDIVRKNLSSELGFSREHRDLNVRRIGYVAYEITKNGGIAICAPIAPYDATRREVRESISSRGGFVLIYLSTPLEVCEQRDRKGLYAKARAGLIPEFTGISDPYEAPQDADLVLDTSKMSVDEACQSIINHLRREGFLENCENWGANMPILPKKSFVNRLSRRIWNLDAEELLAEAQRRTGLSDFGDPPLEPVLSTLLNSLEQEANLHPLGRMLIRMHIRDLLETRLRLTEVWKGKKEVLEAHQIKKPVFVVGIPRSGSTFLHELLGEDRDNRAPRFWEVMFPLPRLAGAEMDRKWRIFKAEFCLWWFRRFAPQADAVYPMRAHTPHECVGIHSHTFLSEEFVSTFDIPTYQNFLNSAEMRPVFAWQKRFLQHLDLEYPGKRWILKSPDHVSHLEELFSVFPDALIVQTHRNPVEVVKSLAELTLVLRGLYGPPGDLEIIRDREAQRLAEHTECLLRFRDRHPELANRFIDEDYTRFVANPLATVRRIYERLEAPLPEEAALRMERLALLRSRYRGHRASAEPGSLNLKSSMEIEVFKRYCARFGLSYQETEMR